jgi:hypothetical protein
MVSEQYASIRDIPRVARANLRNRFDGMKSAIHAASGSGSLEAVRLLGACPPLQRCAGPVG